MPNHPQGAAFATTRWTIVLAAGGPVSDESRTALATLCSLYWYPLYAFVRRRGYTAEEAEDLTQGFFARVLEKQVVADAKPERGRFRSYLLGAMKQFLSNERDRAGAQKRGGGRAMVPLTIDPDDAALRFSRDAQGDLSPDRLFDRQWALTAINLAMQQLRRTYERQGNGRLFDRLKDCLTGDDLGLTYHEIGLELGLSDGAVKSAAHRMRGRFRELLRDQIGQTVHGPAEIDDEVRQLFEALRG